MPCIMSGVKQSDIYEKSQESRYKAIYSCQAGASWLGVSNKISKWDSRQARAPALSQMRTVSDEDGPLKTSASPQQKRRHIGIVIKFHFETHGIWIVLG